MPALFDYLIKTSVCLAVIYLFYRLLLKQMTYYTWNRYFLLGYAVLSTLIPFINISGLINSSSGKAVVFINQLPALSGIPTITTASHTNSFDGFHFLILLFWLGVFVLFCRLMIQIVSLKKLTSQATLLEDGNRKLYHLPLPILPFSFLNCIYLNKDQYSEQELHKIIQHEQVHVEQKHTIDLLMADVICLFNWFNPFAWLLQKAIRENLEFIADESVLENGVDKQHYQYLLLKVTGERPSDISNYLNFSSLKNRINMMNKQRTAKLHLLKFLLLFPLLLILLLAFRSKYEEQTATKNSTAAFTLSSLTYFIPDTKVAAIVKEGQEQSILKTGAFFDLTLVSSEEQRLKQLLERNGYSPIDKHAITFLIDSSAVNSSFSVQVNIMVGQQKLTNNKTGLIPHQNIPALNNPTSYSTTAKQGVAAFLLNGEEIKSNSITHSTNSNKTAK